MSAAGVFFLLGAVSAALGGTLLKAAARGIPEDDSASAVDDGESRFVWRTGGVLVNDHYGVPAPYAGRSLTVEVKDEALIIRRPFRRFVRLHFSEIEGLERIRRTLGAHTTRLHRGVGRSRIDLNLEPEEHACLDRWHSSRAQVERMELNIADARDLVFVNTQRVLALRTHDESPWTVVRGVSEQLVPATEMILERRHDDRALHHLRGRGYRLLTKSHRLEPSWTTRLLALPQVFVLGCEVPWMELRQELEGTTAYR